MSPSTRGGRANSAYLTLPNMDLISSVPGLDEVVYKSRITLPIHGFLFHIHLLPREVMEGTSEPQHVLSGLLNRAIASPYWILCILCAFITLATRIKPAYLKSKLENQTETPAKDIPTIPYYLPYVGHAPPFGWDFDGLLAKARSITSNHT